MSTMSLYHRRTATRHHDDRSAPNGVDVRRPMGLLPPRERAAAAGDESRQCASTGADIARAVMSEGHSSAPPACCRRSAAVRTPSSILRSAGR